MNQQNHKVIYRTDYQPPVYSIDTIFLDFNLQPNATVVTAESAFKKHEESSSHGHDLYLDGEDILLKKILIDGRELSPDEYRVEEKHLVLIAPPPQFSLQVTTEIKPDENKALSGLYRSSGNYCTQCEAEGFRRITYYLDRPDVLARFTTRITADMADNPVLLSNGNLVEKGTLDDDRHYAIWHDPYPKPCYLFALVAGNLFCKQASYVTQSGRNVSLEIYVEPRNKDKCDHAMRSLQKAMKWDEDVYNLEYDLDTYMIVAVDDFNMGAMENKGLNIFNSKYVLSSPETATDQDYLGIEGVIAHEYFHNWTGNRVTCRDWFQLSLKEGLTVFRDQEFSADMNSRAVQRIDDVCIMRNAQFREDASPMAHPVRPESYVEINNFYTVTVYNKGAEVIRMLHRIIGKNNFNRGMELYFKRFDGMAVTCEDFIQAMEDASGVKLDQFRYWYSQAGTPVISAHEQWDDNRKEYILRLSQRCNPTPGQTDKKPFHIPIEIGLIQPAESSKGKIESAELLHLTKKEQEFRYTDLNEKPILSLLRQFSAPVKIETFQSRNDLAFLMACDTDSYNRWDAANNLACQVIFDIIDSLRKKEEPLVDPLFVESFRKCLLSSSDPALIARALTLPTDTYLAQQMTVIEPELLGRAKIFIKAYLGIELRREMLHVYERSREEDAEYRIDPKAMGLRSLKNCCLGYLAAKGAVVDTTMKLCVDQYHCKNNMTDVMAALAAITHMDCTERKSILDDFYATWSHEPLVVDKWLTLQAVSTLESTLSEVKNLMNHEAFSLENPNKIRSLIGAFTSLNHYRFHDESGAGYRFLTENIIKIDKKNPQIAARLVSPMVSYSKYTQKLKSLMEEQLLYIIAQKNISPDVYEIASKSVQQK